MTKCECPLAGFCKRHGVEKSETLHKKCQNDEKYFQSWEECRGPKQEEDCIPQVSRGLGDTIAKITRATGVKKVFDTINKMSKGKGGGCGCSKRQQKLNELVPYGENIDGDN